MPTWQKMPRHMSQMIFLPIFQFPIDIENPTCRIILSLENSKKFVSPKEKEINLRNWGLCLDNILTREKHDMNFDTLHGNWLMDFPCKWAHNMTKIKILYDMMNDNCIFLHLSGKTFINRAEKVLRRSGSKSWWSFRSWVFLYKRFKFHQMKSNTN